MIPPLALVLAGGEARRMGGGQKALLPLNGRPLLAHVLERLAAQTAGAVLSVRDETPFAGFGLPMVQDGPGDHAGPLAGVLAGLDWLAFHHPAQTHLLTVSCDAPFLPRDLASRLAGAITAATPLACATSGGRDHPTHALWNADMRTPLRQALETGERAMIPVMNRFGCARVAFPCTPVDPFFNANTPDELASAAQLVDIAPS